MYVYDFDGTIYDGDSTVRFYLYVLRKKPAVIRHIPRQLFAMLCYKFGKLSKTEMKQHFFCFVKGLPIEKMAADFWQENRKRIRKWYLEQRRTDDVVISASPEFLLKPICTELDVRLLASQVDPHTGVFLSKNCRGQEKVRRFRQAYPDAVVERFYSDSESDRPMAELAEAAFLIRKGIPELWTG